MASELQCVAPSGSAIYCVLWAEAGTVYSSTLPGLEAYTAGHFPAQYPITLTEQGASGRFLGNMPGSLAAGLYLPEVRLQAGGAPAASDPVIGAGTLDWNGTAEVTHGLALGTDGRVLVSANTHTAGETVAAVTGAVGSVTAAVTLPAAPAGYGGATAAAVAAAILATPANLLVTNASGQVVASSVAGAVGSVTGNVGGSVASVVGAVGSVTGNVGGNVTGTVASVVGAVGSVTAGVTVTTNNDKAGYALTSAEHTLVSGTDVPGALTAQGLTTVRAAKIDNLDALVSTRLAATADPTTALAAIKAKSDQLTFTGSNVNADSLVASNVTVAGYASGQSPADFVLATPAQKLATDGAGAISLKAADETLLAAAMPASSYTAPPSAATVAAAILASPSQKLATDALGAVSLKAADETLLAGTMQASSYVAPANASIASALADLVTLIARTDPTANIATILGDVGTILGRVDVAVSSRQPSGAVTVGGYSTGEDPASLLLLTPAHKLASDAAGAVSLPASAPSGYGSSGGTVVSGYSAGQDPASLLLLHPGNLLNTDSSGNVSTAGGSDSASIADILATTSQMSFTSGNINAWAANSVPVPSNAVVVISTTSVNVVAGDMPNILNLQLSRDATFVLTTTALDAAGNLVDLSGGSAVVMVKRNAGDLDADAPLVADSGDVGGIAIADPSTGVLVWTLAAGALSNATTFPDSRPLVWGLKLFLAGGIVRNLIVGTFTVFDFPVGSVTPPA